jgi:hypothetical protein
MAKRLSWVWSYAKSEGDRAPFAIYVTVEEIMNSLVLAALQDLLIKHLQEISWY